MGTSENRLLEVARRSDSTGALVRQGAALNLLEELARQPEVEWVKPVPLGAYWYLAIQLEGEVATRETLKTDTLSEAIIAAEELFREWRSERG